MLNKKKAFLYMSFVFIFLILTSGLHYINIPNPELSHFRHLLRGFLEMIPLIIWYWFVKTRVIQPSVRRYLIIESLTMQFSMFVIYLQTVVVTENINLMALSVIGIFVPYFIFPVFSLMATLCLGMPEQYKLPKVYLLLPATAFILGILCFTNYLHEGFFRFEILPDDINRSSVELRWLCYVTIVFCFVVVLWRLIATHNFIRKSGSIMTFVMILLSYISIGIYHIPYIMNGFVLPWELVGSTQYTFFIEILSWIICMSTGLVPVNTNYDKVFAYSSMEFEIYDKKGKKIYPVLGGGITSEEFTSLTKYGKHQQDTDTILHMSPLKKKGYVVWKEDISYINQLVAEQETIKKQLKEQEELLQNELMIANAKEKIQQKNAIYSKIDDLVKKDILFLDAQIKKLSDENTYHAIIQRGIYIKRKSNLLILNEEKEYIPLSELKLTMDEMITGMYDIEKSFVCLVPLTINIKTQDIISCLELLSEILQENLLTSASLRLEEDESGIYFRVFYELPSGDKKMSELKLTVQQDAPNDQLASADKEVFA